MLLCFTVLANHQPKTDPIKPPEVQIIEEVNTTPAPIVIQVPEKVIDPRREEYVRDCTSYGFTKQWCEDNWDGKSVVKE